MTREELKSHLEYDNEDESVYNKADADSVMDAMEKDNADLHHNLEDWKAENEALKERIKELEYELQVSNRCTEDARERIKELEASQPKWISVDDDEKPKEDEEILFTDGEIIYKGCWTTWDGGCSDLSYVVGSGFVDEVNDESLTEEQITHWMPIPQPPKSEKSTEVIKENLITEQTNKSED